jgi:hypothetical protein
MHFFITDGVRIDVVTVIAVCTFLWFMDWHDNVAFIYGVYEMPSPPIICYDWVIGDVTIPCNVAGN